MVVGAGTTGPLTVQVRNVTDGADMLSTAMTIDSAQLTNATASVPLVINASTDDVVTGDVLRIDIDTVHSTLPRTGRHAWVCRAADLSQAFRAHHSATVTLVDSTQRAGSGANVTDIACGPAAFDRMMVVCCL